MKQMFHSDNSRHFYLGRMASRTNDEFIEYRNEKIDVKPAGLRWFCGMQDMSLAYPCQAI